MNMLTCASKNVGEAASARQQQANKRSLRVVNEHCEPVFNAAMARVAPKAPSQQVGFRGARLALLGLIVALAGCQSTHEQLLAEGYPPAFADGFQDGCGSGRQAAGSIGGQYRKDVPRYLREKLYAQGWDDGLRQCQAMQESRDRESNGWSSDRDRAWEQQKTRDKARAYRPD